MTPPCGVPLSRPMRLPFSHLSMYKSAHGQSVATSSTTRSRCRCLDLAAAHKPNAPYIWV
jgi:hypothetical protein